MGGRGRIGLIVLAMIVAAPLCLAQPGAIGSEPLQLTTAVSIAQQQDPWLAGNHLSQEATLASSIAAGSLPDPSVTVGLLNLPTDTFDFDQEAMTQFRVGIAQRFPQGRSRSLNRERLQTLAQQFPYQRQNRRVQVAATVSELWLQLFELQRSVALIDDDRALFEQLADVAFASYASASGRSRQSDVVRAELELTRLQDRLTSLAEREAVARQELGMWLWAGAVEPDLAETAVPASFHWRLPQRMPDVPLAGPLPDDDVLPQRLARHPSVVALDRKIDASSLAVDVVRQQYKPTWGINAGYAYRDDDPMGNERADFLSIGVSMDMPLFHANRQDRRVQAATAEAGAVKTEKWLLLRELMAGFSGARARLEQLDSRRLLYRERLLPQMRQQALSSLSAYTSDEGDFAEVVRARIAELNAQIEALAIDVARQRTIVRLNYYLASATDAGDEAG